MSVFGVYQSEKVTPAPPRPLFPVLSDSLSLPPQQTGQEDAVDLKPDQTLLEIDGGEEFANNSSGTL